MSLIYRDGKMTHQAAMLCAAKLAGCDLPDGNGGLADVYAYLAARSTTDHDRKAYGTVTISLAHGIGLDDLVAIREKVREQGYDCEARSGDLVVTGRWSG